MTRAAPRALSLQNYWENPRMRAVRDGASRGLFLESPETFRAHFGWHNSLCIFKTKPSRGTKRRSYFYFYSLYNIWKDQLYRISRSEFYEWLFGPEKFSGLSRNGPQDCEWDFIWLVGLPCIFKNNFAVFFRSAGKWKNIQWRSSSRRRSAWGKIKRYQQICNWCAVSYTHLTLPTKLEV